MPLLAYDRNGSVMATLDFLVLPDEDGVPQVVDFASLEESGGKLRACWDVSGAAGSTYWPEYLGVRAHEFRVRVDERFNKRARFLEHRRSGVKREREEVDRAIERTIGRTPPGRDGLRRVSLQEVRGSPQRPLSLDKDGHTRVPEVVPQDVPLHRPRGRVRVSDTPDERGRP